MSANGDRVPEQEERDRDYVDHSPRGGRIIHLGNSGGGTYTRDAVTIAFGPDEYDPGMDAPQHHMRAFQRDRDTLRFHFTNQHRWRNAREFKVPDRTVREVLPRIYFLGPESYMEGETFMVDQFCSSRVFEYQISAEELVAAYNLIFPILIHRRPIFPEMQYQYGQLQGRSATYDFWTLFLNLSFLLSNERGLGAAGWLQSDFAEASMQMWAEASASLRQGKRIDMFLSNLEPFTTVLRTPDTNHFSPTINRVERIWAAFDRETQLSIREAAISDSEVLGTGCAMSVHQAVDCLTIRSPIHPERGGGSARGSGPARGGGLAHGGRVPDPEEDDLQSDGGREDSQSAQAQRRGQDTEQHNDEMQIEVPGRGETLQRFSEDETGREPARFLWRRGPGFYLTRQPGGRWETHEYEDSREAQRARASGWTAGPGFDRIPRTRGPREEGRDRGRLAFPGFPEMPEMPRPQFSARRNGSFGDAYRFGRL